MAKSQNYWQDIQTLQSKEIISELIEAKENRRALLIISDTGLGKTNSIKIFAKKMPRNTYVITVGDSFKLEDIVNEIIASLGMEIPERRERFGYRAVGIKIKLDQIKKKIGEIVEGGGEPIIILDEAENLKPSVLKMIKELYDAIIDDCSIVMIGTDQIMDAILNRKHKNRQSVPQLYRRFKAGIRYVSPINKARDFVPFFKTYIPNETGLQDLLMQCCENFGELHDYLEPLLRYADKNSKPVTEELFRLIHKMPKLKR